MFYSLAFFFCSNTILLLRLMSVSTADSSCLRMLIRIMTGFLQIIPMRISRISGRRGCTQSLLPTCLRQTSKLCLATTHVSLGTWTTYLYCIFYSTWTSFFLELELLLWDLAGLLVSDGEEHFLYMNFIFIFFILLVYFVSVFFLPFLTWTGAFLLLELQRWCLSMLLSAVVECFPVHQFYLELCLLVVPELHLVFKCN